MAKNISKEKATRLGALFPSSQNTFISQTFSELAITPRFKCNFSSLVGVPLRYLLDMRKDTVPMALQARLAISSLNEFHPQDSIKSIVRDRVEPELSELTKNIAGLAQWRKDHLNQVKTEFSVVNTRHEALSVENTLREEALQVEVEIAKNDFYSLLMISNIK